MPRNDATAFVSLDVSGLAAQAQKCIDGIEGAGRLAEEAFDRALAQVAEDILGDMQDAALAGKGDLRGAATTVGPSKDGLDTVILIGFNLIYAAIRDQGGDIYPDKARALFIPLREGAMPGDPGLKMGEDFITVPGPMTRKNHVHQTGNGYVTLTFERRKGAVGLEVGKLMNAFLVGGA